MSVNEPVWGKVVVAAATLELNGYVVHTEDGVHLTSKGWNKAKELWSAISDEDKLLIGFIARQQIKGKETIL